MNKEEIKMNKKVGLGTVALIMALLMVAVAPLQVFAATQVEYISEIRIGYGEQGKKDLLAAEYTLWEYNKEYLNANEGGKGNAVYIGYKTTTVKADAITDMAIMPMRINGESPFSFDRYGEEMTYISEQIDVMLTNFDDAIAEFRTNLKKPSPQNEYAQIAYEMLNQYTEDDSGLGVGELFAMERLNAADTDGSALRDTYHKILMTGNSIVVSAIETALAMGCTETGGETFLDRLQKSTYTGEVDANYNDAVNVLASQMDSLREEVLIAKAVHDAAYAYPEGHVKYVESLADADRATALKQIALIEILSEIQYADLTLDEKRLSFLDVVMMPTDVTAGEVCLTADMLEPLAKAMTPGQISVLQYAPLYILIANAYSVRFPMVTDTDGSVHYDLDLADTYLAIFKQQDKISVYTGVDRSVFDDKNYGTVAITDAAIQGDLLADSFGVSADYKTSNKYKIIGCVGSTVAAVGGVTFLYACFNIGQARSFPVKEVVEAVEEFKFSTMTRPNIFTGTYAEYETALRTGQIQLQDKTELLLMEPTGNMKGVVVGTEPLPVQCYTSLGTKIALTAGAIALAIGIALAIYGFVLDAKASKPQQIEYDPIPRAIIDLRRDEKTGEDKYFVYYAARLIGASDDYVNEKDTTKLYGDLNGLNGYEQWACLYYAKDMRLGSPITTKTLIQATTSLSALQVNNYVPIHSFFDNTLIANNTGYTPMSLNQYSTSGNAAKIYVFLKRDTKTSPLTSTVLNDGTSVNWLPLVTFFVGAGLAAGAAVVVNRKKNKSDTRTEA